MVGLEIEDDKENDTTLLLPHDHIAPPRVVSLMGLVVITHFMTSGGPYGIEQTFSYAPPLFVILSFIIVPFFWSLPQALLTAELSGALPEDGGCVVWAEAAFGEFVSFQAGFLTWVNNLIDLPLYPKITTGYLYAVTGNFTNNSIFWNWLVEASSVIVMCILNIFGLEMVEKASYIFSVIVLIPSAIFCFISPIKGFVDPKVWFITSWGENHPKYQWGLLLSTQLWMFTGFDSVGTLAGEVKNPSYTYPRAMTLNILITIITYLGPLMAGVSVDQNWQNWNEEHLSYVAGFIAGEWLQILYGVGGIVAALGLLNCLLGSSSRTVYAMSERGFLFKFFSILHATRRTPFLSIILNSVIVSVLLLQNFEVLLELDSAINSVRMIFNVVFWAKLKWSHPELKRPYKTPGGKFSFLWMIPILGLSIFYLVIISWKSQVFLLGTIVLGILFYFLRDLIKKHFSKEPIKITTVYGKNGTFSTEVKQYLLGSRI